MRRLLPGVPALAASVGLLLAASVGLLLVASIGPALGASVDAAGGAARAGQVGGGAGRGLPVPEHEADEVRSAADEVLDRPEYERPSPTILQRVRNWVIERIEQALGALLGRGQATVVAWAVLVAALGVLGYLLVRFTRGVTPDAVRGPQYRPERRRSPEEWRADADAAARAGRWREAVRFRYRALVAELGRRGLVDDVPGRTAGEYRREVAGAAPEAAPAFSEASELFEVAWYGHRPTDAEQDARLRDLSDRVLADSQ